MIFKRLLNTKWRKEKSVDKPVALDPANLAVQAAEASDPGARRQACKQVIDLDLLQGIALKDQDAGVREFAAARLRNLLCGHEPKGPDTATRLTRLAGMDDEQIINHVALNGMEPELRRSALQRVQQAQTLAECAMRDKIAAVRLAAVERLEDKAELERVARKIGKKDKSVYRLARQKIKTISERELAPARLKAKAEELCEKVEILSRRSLWMQDKASFDHLDKQWTELGAELSADTSARFEQAKSTFMAGYETYRNENLARIQEEENLEQLRASKQTLLEALKNMRPEGDLETAEAALAELVQRWRALADLPPSEERKLQKTFEEVGAPIRQGLAQRQAISQRGERLTQLLENAQKWQNLSAPLDQKQVHKWTKQGQELAAMQAEDTLAKRFGEVRDRLQKQLKKQLAHSEQRLEKLPQRLEELERELEEGILKKATGLHQSIHADLNLLGLSGLNHARYAGLEQQFRQLTPRLRELQKWRKWGTDQHRVDLCEAMEKLLDLEVPLDELTEQVQALQSQWKQLDQGGSPVNESLWKRFHQAADKSYERCRPYLDQQAEIKLANRDAREDLCKQLEEFLAQVNWEDMDWKKAVRAEREMRTAWSEIGPVDPKHRRTLDKRFRAALKELDGHLSKERNSNREYKKELIDKAQALRDIPDVDQAIEAIKQLQKQWYTTVAGKRKQENQLWQRFREACDAVFERRREIQQTHRNELTEQLNRRRALCAELEALPKTLETPADELLQGLREIQERWTESKQRQVPRQEEGKLQRRWQSAEEGLHKRVHELRHAAQQEQIDRMFHHAQLCAELEAEVEAGTCADAAHWQARWEALAALKDKRMSTRIRKRFDAALSVAADSENRASWLAKLTANLTSRSELCLRLEVLAGIESPPEAAQERLEFQVSRLSERLSQGEQDPLNEIPEVERAWCLYGPAPSADMQRLEARFQHARQAISNEVPRKTQNETATEGTAS